MARVASNDYRQMLEEILAAEMGDSNGNAHELHEKSVPKEMGRYSAKRSGVDPEMYTEPSGPNKALSTSGANAPQTSSKPVAPTGEDPTSAAMRRRMETNTPYVQDPDAGLEEDLPILEQEGSEKGFMQARIDRLLNDIGGPDNLDGITLEDVEAYLQFNRGSSDETIQMFNNLNAQAKFQAIQDVVEADGLAGFADILGYRQEEDETYGPRRGQ